MKRVCYKLPSFQHVTTKCRGQVSWIHHERCPGRWRLHVHC